MLGLIPKGFLVDHKLRSLGEVQGDRRVPQANDLAWANAHRLDQDHELEVLQLIVQAHQAVTL